MANSYGPRPSMSRIESAVCAAAELTGVSPEQIRSRSPARKVARARWLVWRTLHLEGFGFAPIANVWGCDHTTIMHAASQGWGLATAQPAPLMIWAPRYRPQRRAA